MNKCENCGFISISKKRWICKKCGGTLSGANNERTKKSDKKRIPWKDGRDKTNKSKS